MPGAMSRVRAANVHDRASLALALTVPNGYADLFPCCAAANADINGDQTANSPDVLDFLQALLGG